MIMKSQNTDKKLKTNNFDISEHINIRNFRHKSANINSLDLPGLSTIELNVTELCNRTCSFCPRRDPEVYANQKLFMSLDTVTNLVDQIRKTDWYGDVHITGFGEPHTHPYLKEIITILRKANVYIEVTSNGDRLIDTHIDYAIEMFKAGLDKLTIDCYDGQKQYLKREEIMKNTFDPLHYNWRLRAHFDDGNTEQLMQDYGFNNRAGSMGGSGVQNQCFLPFYKTFIDWNGDMTLCCNDWHREAGTMGNVIKNGLVDCWNSDKMKYIRSQLYQGIRKGVCGKCNIKGTKFGASSVDVHVDKDLLRIDS